MFIFIYKLCLVCYHGHKKSNSSKTRHSCPTDLPETLYCSLRRQTRSLDKQGPCPQREHSSFSRWPLWKCSPSRPRQTSCSTNLSPKSFPAWILSLQCQDAGPATPARSLYLPTSGARPRWPRAPQPRALHRPPPPPPPRVPITPEPPTSQTLLGRKKLHLCTHSPAYLAKNQGFLEITCFLENHTLWHSCTYSAQTPAPATYTLTRRSSLGMELTNHHGEGACTQILPKPFKILTTPTYRITLLIFLYSSQINTLVF